MFDVTDRNGFLDLGSSVNFLRNQLEGVRIILLANKVDLEHIRAISTNEITDFAFRHGMPFVEVSALSGFHTERAFQLLLTDIFNYLSSSGILPAF